MSRQTVECRSDRRRNGESVSRRHFLRSGVASAAALAALSRTEWALAGPGGGRPRGGGMTFDPDLVLLIDRITGGFSLAEYEHAESHGYEGYLAEQLGYESLIGANDPNLAARLANFNIYNMTAQQIAATYNPTQMTQVPLRQTIAIQLIWAVYGKAQLYYRMFQFWNHHLNVDINSSNAQRFLLWPFLRDVVLANSMTNFPALIAASAHGPAMLVYLNNNTNVASAPDENYARELMELHTLGVDNGYTQTDVEELARVLTGWSACLNFNGCGATPYGEFRFIPGNHDTGNKIVLDNFIQGLSGAAGIQEGEQVLGILTAHPNTADHIARKLCRFFLGGIDYSYDPPEDIVQFVKYTYLNSNPIGDIRAMLEIILHRDVLTQHAQPKFRRPFDLTTASLRAVGANLAINGNNPLPDLRFDLDNMGMVPSSWGPPNGPYDSQAWSEGGMLARWSYLDELAGNNIAEAADFTVAGLLAPIGATAPGAQAQGLSNLLSGGRLSDKEKQALQGFIGYGTPSEATLKEALALAMQMPTYQFA